MPMCSAALPHVGPGSRSRYPCPPPTPHTSDFSNAGGLKCERKQARLKPQKLQAPTPNLVSTATLTRHHRPTTTHLPTMADSNATTNNNNNNRGGGHRGGGRGGGGGFRGRGGGGGGGHRGGRGGHGGHQQGGEGGERSERPKKENILDLSKYQDKEIRVKFAGGREGAFCCLAGLLCLPTHSHYPRYQPP